jgi:hypothetical protein
LLVVGLPRSGTTWTAHVLAQAPGCTAVLEPDNEKTSAPAIAAKRNLGRFPVLGADDAAPGFEQLWAWALRGAPPSRAGRAGARLVRGADADALERLVAGRPPPRLRLAGALARLPRGRLGPPVPAAPGTSVPGNRPGRLLVKSVHAVLALEWLTTRFDLDVVVVLRHPANVLASWLELDLPDADRGLDRHPGVRARYVDPWALPAPGPTALERAAWHVGLLSAVMEDAAARHPRWLVCAHEELCREPAAGFRRLYDALGLPWDGGVDRALAATDAPGTGFSLQRRAAELPDAWRTRLDGGQVATLHRVLAGFPLLRSVADTADWPATAAGTDADTDAGADADTDAGAETNTDTGCRPPAHR